MSEESEKVEEQVEVHVDVELRGSFTIKMSKAAAEKLIDEMDGKLGRVHTDELPFPVDWDEVINIGEPTVEDLWIKA